MVSSTQSPVASAKELELSGNVTWSPFLDYEKEENAVILKEIFIAIDSGRLQELSNEKKEIFILLMMSVVLNGREQNVHVIFIWLTVSLIHSSGKLSPFHDEFCDPRHILAELTCHKQMVQMKPIENQAWIRTIVFGSKFYSTSVGKLDTSIDGKLG